jgi:hypothetical protein
MAGAPVIPSRMKALTLCVCHVRCRIKSPACGRRNHKMDALWLVQRKRIATTALMCCGLKT